MAGALKVPTRRITIGERIRYDAVSDIRCHTVPTRRRLKGLDTSAYPDGRAEGATWCYFGPNSRVGFRNKAAADPQSIWIKMGEKAARGENIPPHIGAIRLT